MKLDPFHGRFGYGVARLALPAETYRPTESPLSLTAGALYALGDVLGDARLAARLLGNASLALLLAIAAASLTWSALRAPDEIGVRIVAFEAAAEPVPEPKEPARLPELEPEPVPEPGEPVRLPEPEPSRAAKPPPRPAPEPPRPHLLPEPLAVALAQPPPAPPVVRDRPISRREAPPPRGLPQIQPLEAPAALAAQAEPELPARVERQVRPEPARQAPRLGALPVSGSVLPASAPPPSAAPRWRAVRERVLEPSSAGAFVAELAPAVPAPLTGPVAPSAPRSPRTAPPARPEVPSLSPSALALPGTRPSTPGAPVPAAPASLPARAGPQSAVRGRRSKGRRLRGVPLGSLAACVSDREEERLKQRLIAAVTTQGECASEAGHYRFLETRNLNAFLMTVERAPGRAEADRCAELAHALDCVGGRGSGGR